MDGEPGQDWAADARAAAGETVPTAFFDSRDFAPHERHAVFERLTPGYDTILPAGSTSADLEFRCSGWLLGDLVLTSNQFSAIDLWRSPAHIRAYARETYTLILAQGGRWWAELDYGDVHVGSGQVCLMDFTVPWRVHGTAQQNVMLMFPKAAIEAALPNAPRLHGKLLEGPSGRLFAEHLVALARHMPDVSQADVPFIRDATMALLTSALAALPAGAPAPAPRTSQRTTPLVRIHAFIDEHLTSPDLSVERICRELAVARPTLYRAFAPWGGVSNYIQRRRLEAAHSRLSDSRVRMTMAEIADDYCFSSPSHFSTAFRRRFGYTPRDAKASPQKIGGAADLFDTYLQTKAETDRRPHSTASRVA